MKIALFDNKNKDRIIALYQLIQENLDSPVFNGEEYGNIRYAYHLLSKHNKNSHNEIHNHLYHNYIFLHWNSYLYFSNEKYYYEVISIDSISRPEIDCAIEFCTKLHLSGKNSTSLIEDETEIDGITELSKNIHYKQDPILIWDSELLGGRDKFGKLKDLDNKNLNFVNPKMVDYYDAINFDNKGRWIIQYSDGNAGSMFRSFEMYWGFPQFNDYIDHIKYGIDYGTEINEMGLKKLLDAEDYANVINQMKQDINNTRDHFDDLKLGLLQQAERLYYMYSKSRIELIVDFN